MTQEFQSIGGISPALQAVVNERQGWQGEDAEDPSAQMTRSSDFSFRARRANFQAEGFGRVGPGAASPLQSMAGYQPPAPMAGISVSPPQDPVMPPDDDRMQVTW